MKKLFILFVFMLTTVNVNAQFLSKSELNALTMENMNAMEQMKQQSSNIFTERATFVSVGDTSDCNYYTGSTRIQDAIDAGHAEIRIVSGVYSENLIIDKKNTQLLGGYSNCADANNNLYDDTQKAFIMPPYQSGEPALKITGNDTRYYVTLRQLLMSGGESKGGIAIRDADLGLQVFDVDIQQNKGDYGGGFSVVNGQADIFLNGVGIRGNTATVVGGGLYCRGSENNIIMDSSVLTVGGIGGNLAPRGGGAYISVGCKLSNYMGHQNSTTFGIVANQATEHGGGIYAASGAQVMLLGNYYCSEMNPTLCYGNNSEPVNINDNTADSDLDDAGDGGAIYATGNGTLVYGANLLVSNNEAVAGAGVFVADNAVFQTETTYNNGSAGQANDCWATGRCNQFIGNKSIANSTTAAGGAFAQLSGGKVQIIRSHIENNRADVGAAFLTGEIDTELHIEGSYITGNGAEDSNGYLDLFPITIGADSTARIDYSTIADNNAQSGSIYNYKGNLSVLSSIVHEQSSVPALVNSSAQSSFNDCIIANKLGDFSQNYSLELDPQFVDRYNNDYHIIARYSPAVDFCDSSIAQYTTTDTDGDERGWDDYTVNNLYGPYDIGADETYDNDIIFKDGFE